MDLIQGGRYQPLEFLKQLSEKDGQINGNVLAFTRKVGCVFLARNSKDVVEYREATGDLIIGKIPDRSAGGLHLYNKQEIADLLQKENIASTI